MPAASETAVVIPMPRLTDSMEEGVVVKWLKEVGDELSVGDELVEIETDKANMVYESDVAGRLIEVVAAEGQALAIGEPIAKVASDGAPAQPSARPPTEQANAGSPASPSDAAPVPADAPPGGARGRRAGRRPPASPVARRLAEKVGLDLEQIEGTGPGGRIIKADVERAQALAQPAHGTNTADPGSPPKPVEAAKGEVETVELSRLRQTVARRMAESKATAPHFFLSTEIDVGAAFIARSRLKESAVEGEVIPSFNDLVVKACALALREYPRANGAYGDGKLELFSRVNVGIAVAAPEALVVPTIFDADRKGLREIATEARELAQKVRDGTVTPPELSGGTFTLSNLGMYGINSFMPVINPPQSAILGVGEIAERAVVRDGQLTIARIMVASLACDHRILTGAEAAEFLGRIRALLEEPLALAI